MTGPTPNPRRRSDGADQITVRTELESILVEQALAMARELEALTDAAPGRAVLAVGGWPPSGWAMS